MKISIPFLLAGSLILTSGCTFNPEPLALPAVGPENSVGAKSASNGSLIVYSAWDALGNRYRRDHSDYKILSADGALVRRVTNAICFGDDDPVRIDLPAGRYQVLAMSETAGKVVVPVQICVGQTTFVRLEGYDSLRRSLVGEKSVVKLPNGEIVGWAAAPTAN
jgi:hypothetical protein